MRARSFWDEPTEESIAASRYFIKRNWKGLRVFAGEELLVSFELQLLRYVGKWDGRIFKFEYLYSNFLQPEEPYISGDRTRVCTGFRHPELALERDGSLRLGNANFRCIAQGARGLLQLPGGEIGWIVRETWREHEVNKADFVIEVPNPAAFEDQLKPALFTAAFWAQYRL